MDEQALRHVHFKHGSVHSAGVRQVHSYDLCGEWWNDRVIADFPHQAFHRVEFIEWNAENFTTPIFDAEDQYPSARIRQGSEFVSQLASARSVNLCPFEDYGLEFKRKRQGGCGLCGAAGAGKLAG